jgi:hypothetical protein
MLCWWVRVHSRQGQLGSVFSHVSTVGTAKQFHVSDHPHVGNQPQTKTKKNTHTHPLLASSMKIVQMKKLQISFFEENSW